MHHWKGISQGFYGIIRVVLRICEMQFFRELLKKEGIKSLF